MKRDELIQNCKEILIATQSKRLQKLFYQRKENQDIVIEKITRADINSFCDGMLKRLEKYIEK